VGDNWGSLEIEDLRPIVATEDGVREEREIKLAKVAVSDKKLTPKEMFRKYADRVWYSTGY
jgi:hypothetical protein